MSKLSESSLLTAATNVTSEWFNFTVVTINPWFLGTRVRPGQVRSDRVWSGWVRWGKGEVGSGLILLGPVGSCWVRSGRVGSGWVRSGRISWDTDLTSSLWNNDQPNFKRYQIFFLNWICCQFEDKKCWNNNNKPLCICFSLNLNSMTLELTFWLQAILKIIFLLTCFSVNFEINLYFWIVVSVQEPRSIEEEHICV